MENLTIKLNKLNQDDQVTVLETTAYLLNDENLEEDKDKSAIEFNLELYKTGKYDAVFRNKDSVKTLGGHSVKITDAFEYKDKIYFSTE